MLDVLSLAIREVERSGRASVLKIRVGALESIFSGHRKRIEELEWELLSKNLGPRRGYGEDRLNQGPLCFSEDAASLMQW